MATSWLPEKETEAPSGLRVLLRLAHQYGRWSRETVSRGCGFGRCVHGIDVILAELEITVEHRTFSDHFLSKMYSDQLNCPNT